MDHDCAIEGATHAVLFGLDDHRQGHIQFAGPHMILWPERATGQHRGEVLADLFSGQFRQRTVQPRDPGRGQDPRWFTTHHHDQDDILLRPQSGDDAVQFALVGGAVRRVVDSVRQLHSACAQIGEAFAEDHRGGDDHGDGSRHHPDRHQRQQDALTYGTSDSHHG